MIELRASSIFHYKAKKIHHLLFFSIINDNICKEIEKNLEYFEKENGKVIVIKVCWWDFISLFIVPKSVSMYTVFYFYQAAVVGSIVKPNMYQLNLFFNKCYKIIKSKDWAEKRLYYFRKYRGRRKYKQNDDMSLNLINDLDVNTLESKELIVNSQMKLISMDCRVFQFKKKERTVESIFIYYRNRTLYIIY